MKLTKQLEKEVKQAYEAFWKSLLSVDMKRFNSLLDDDFRQIGTTEAEAFFNKKDAAKFLKVTEKQLVGNIELRNQKLKIEPLDKYVLITDLSDCYVKIDNEWAFYDRGRNTFLLHKTIKGWKFILQHTSFPDQRTGEGETIGLEKVAKENLELRDAIKRRTIELEGKNRELEIEAALERVRSQVNSMHRSEELIEVCKTLLSELQSLGFKNIRNTQVALANDAKGSYMSYDYYTNGKSYLGELLYNSHPLIKSLAVKMRQNKAEFIHVSLKGKQLNNWRKYLKSLINQPAPKLDAATSLNYYYYSIGPGGLGFCAYSALGDDEMTVLKRFKNVFDQTYTRFLDLQKAEAQTREVQIENALEKIRSRSLAMHKSDELWEVVSVVFEKFQDLKFSIDGAAFILTFLKGTKDANIWIGDDKGQSYPTSIRLPFNEAAPVKDFWLAGESGVEFFSKTYPFEEKNRWFRYAFEHTDIKMLSDELKNWILEQPCLTQSFALGKNSMIGIHFHHQKTLTETEIDILKRFSKVFDQAYIRFLDLQKAEAQAREAQIEAGLERVRSRSMAMHKSEELSEVVALVYEEIKPFGFATAGVELILIDEKNELQQYWVSTATKNKIIECFNIPTSIHSHFQKQWKAWEDQIPRLTLTLEGQEKKAFDQLIFTKTDFKNLSDDVKEFILNHGNVDVFSHVIMKYGLLEAVDKSPLSEEKFVLLERFAKVFEQTYTRFLDLQKAEAQAREAEIQLALERVRAATMAMHQSDELANVVSLMYAQIKNLGFTDWGCAIVLCDEESQSIRYWYAEINMSHSPEFFTVPITNKTIRKTWKLWKQGIPQFTIELLNKRKDEYTEYMLTETDHKNLPNEVKEGWRSSENVFFSYTNIKYGLLEFTNVVPFAEENFLVYQRFAKVFEQTYTRFLDLQKAEAQARESEIQLALERVRAATMAMHQGNELAQVVALMYAQIQNLGFTDFGCSIIICDDKARVMRYWYAEINMPHLPEYCNVPLTNKIVKKAWKLWQSGVPQFDISLLGKEKESYTSFMLNDTDYQYIPEEVKEEWRKHKNIFLSYFTFKYGMLEFLDIKPLNSENYPVYDRFSKVFEQTYTRFLDLQKAEAQAREAQIEAALERVRSRSLAMHKSEELVDVATILHKELKNLDVREFSKADIVIFDESKNQQIIWGSRTEADYLEMAVFPLLGDEILQKLYDLWCRKETFFTVKVGGSALKKHCDFVFPIASRTELEAKVLESMPDPTFFHCAYFSMGYLELVADKELSEGSSVILTRFAKVFDQTYTRFLDLQNAEAQARESQIQLAMERVRAKTMAMQNSNELPEAANLLFQQVKSLGMPSWAAAFAIWDENKQSVSVWASAEDILMPSYKAPLTEDPTLIHMKEAYDRGETFFVEEIGGEDLVKHYQYMASLPVVGELLSKVNEAGHPLPTFQINHCAYFAQGFLLFITYEPVPEAHDIFKRFAKVFEQTYTRFLDLQKAEAQAREAQIEAGLERVRSRSMAMHKSDELEQVVEVLTDQFRMLNSNIVTCWIALVNVETNTMEIWNHTDMMGSRKSNYTVHGKDFHTFQSDIDAFKNKERFRQFSFEKEAAKKILKEQLEFELVISEESTDYHLLQYRHNFGFIGYSSWSEPEEQGHSLLQRFAKVFEQTYTRFLDLQKAEAQAREAKIEAALERVRSRTMAMQHSEELSEAAVLLFQQVKSFGLESLGCGFNIWEKDDKVCTSYFANLEGNLVEPFTVPLTEDPIFIRFYESRHNGEDFWTQEISGQEEIDHYKYLCSLPVVGKMLNGLLAAGIPFPTFQIDHGVNFLHGNLLFITYAPVPEAHDIFKRFGKVFEQTYIRFLDLQKAEAQAREAKIEAALERVRSRSMAMGKTDELTEIIGTIFTELSRLDVALLRCVIEIWNSETYDQRWWMANAEDAKRPVSFFIKYIDLPPNKAFLNAWKKKLNKWVYLMKGDIKSEWDRRMLSETELSFLPESVKTGMRNPAPTYCNTSFNNYGCLTFVSPEALPDDQFDILIRFATVFDQTYTRFNDLKNAEAQAREAQIEAALERVRSKTMAMHNSQDVGETVATMFDELVKLGVETLRCGVGIMQEPHQMELWTATKSENEKVELIIGRLDMTIHPMLLGIFNGWKNKNITFSYELKDQDLVDYIKAVFNSPDYHIKYDIASMPEQQFHNDFYFPEGALFSFSAEQLSIEASQIFKRFAGVFGQTYRRYLDLQKAEAQAREATIEASLERVRARTMAMHNSEDVTSATETMFEEFKKLGIDNLRCGIANVHLSRTFDVFGVTNLSGGKKMSGFGFFGMDEHPVWQRWFESWINKEDVFIAYIAGQEKEEYFNNINIHNNYLPQQIVNFPDSFFQAYYFGQGSVWAYSLSEHSESEKDIMKRFATSFSLTFRRYQDLQKAEAQAREATIEASLERVRGKAMAMHSSKDLATTIGVFYHELESLNLTPRRCGVGLINKETWTAEISTMNAATDGQSIELVGVLDMRSHPVLTSVYNNWLTKTDYHPVLRGNEIKEYYQVVRPQIAFQDYTNDTVQHGYFFFFEEGGVYAWTEKELNEDELKIYRRFTSVLSLTYKRYKDLKDAEARAQNAIKEAALDRIRADIASMRTIADLDKITPLIWNELNVLGIPFIRCGVFIMDDDQQLIHTFLSTPDGKAIAAFHLPYDTPGNFADILVHWKSRKIYINNWSEVDFIGIAETLVKQGAIETKEQYLNTLPQKGFYLHFLPFLQGMLYVGNTGKLGNEEIELIQHVADAFSTAYARYEDFNKLEAAKQTVEKTLTDLKQTQAQLVQSEKMASLGELTAGIAHEIQNPLNFVNNFSEVSNELISEMVEEVDKGNTEEVKIIAKDVQQNLEKILHHGKRADAIVKGMLQHSRSSSGVKEPTDINALADEYLRLAYHGLRAKDKSFNATMKTDYDETIGNVNIIPQDIGRVILNLITNAFYVVNEKAKKGIEGYEPTVSVSTKKGKDKVEVKVADNGNGIPPKILDKIFQPFFTTKPTGQGTGLGLSLSYDIVKAHGGELKVETPPAGRAGKEGEGSEFIIQLPAS